MVAIQALRDKSQIKEALLKNDPSLLPLSAISKQHFFKILNQLQNVSQNKTMQESSVFLEKEIIAITKIPYERHKLSLIEITKICMAANKFLQEAAVKGEITYLRSSDTGLERSLVIDGKRGAFTILSKHYGKLFASGTFKKVTDAIDVVTKNTITANRVVRLVNKAGKPLQEKELLLHKQFGLILTRVDYLSKKRQNEFKTTVIEEAYDHDLHFFTNTDKYSKKNRINTSDLIEVLKQITSQIALMHKEGYAHRDIKTKNALFKKEPDGTIKAQLIDFGHAVSITTTATTKKDRRHNYGTVRYGSPELLEPKNQLSNLMAQRQAEDMYALGCFIYELLFFKPLPWAKEYYQAAKDISASSAKEKAIAKQNETHTSLLATYSLSAKTTFEKLSAVVANLLDPNPSTRMSIEDFLKFISSLYTP